MVKEVNRSLLVALVLTVGMASVAIADNGSTLAVPELQHCAFAALRGEMSHGHLWHKVHAAEYLLWLGYPDGVRESFLREQDSLDSEPQYRIGIWRVLAQSAPNDQEREKWLGKIRDVLVSASPPDRPNAAETLTKLGYKLQNDDVEKVERIAAASQREPMISYLVCLLAQAGQPGAEERLLALLKSPDPQIRLTAAYAIRFLATISAESRDKLLAAAANEPRESPARANVISAIAIQSRPNGDPAWKQELAKITKDGKNEERIDACQALAIVGDTSDLSSMIPLLNSSDPDSRTTGAYAALRISRRVPHRLAALDWVVIAFYGLIVLGVGWYYSQRNKTPDDYLLGGHANEAANGRYIAVRLAHQRDLVFRISWRGHQEWSNDYQRRLRLSFGRPCGRLADHRPSVVHLGGIRQAPTKMLEVQQRPTFRRPRHLYLYQYSFCGCR